MRLLRNRLTFESFLVAPAVLIVLLLFAVPLIMLFYSSLSFTDLKPFVEVAKDSLYLRVLADTFFIAAVVTAACAVLGLPIAHYLAHSSKIEASIIVICVMLPFWTSLLVRTYAWMVLLGYNGLINQTLIGLGITTKPIQLMHNKLGTIIGMVHVLLPYMIFTTYTSVIRMDRTILGAAAGLGANPLRVFVLIYLPMIRAGLIAGSSLVFILSIGFYITPVVLGGGRVITVAMLIEQQVSKALNWEVATALSAVLLVCTLVIVSFMNSRVIRGKSV